MNELTNLMPLLLRQSGHKDHLRVSRIAFPDGTTLAMNTIEVDGTKWTGADPERLLTALLTGERHHVRITYTDFTVEFEAVKR